MHHSCEMPGTDVASAKNTHSIHKFSHEENVGDKTEVIFSGCGDKETTLSIADPPNSRDTNNITHVKNDTETASEKVITEEKFEILGPKTEKEFSTTTRNNDNSLYRQQEQQQLDSANRKISTPSLGTIVFGNSFLRHEILKWGWTKDDAIFKDQSWVLGARKFRPDPHQTQSFTKEDVKVACERGSIKVLKHLFYNHNNLFFEEQEAAVIKEGYSTITSTTTSSSLPMLPTATLDHLSALSMPLLATT
eukprot:Awhi_evm1s3467